MSYTFNGDPEGNGIEVSQSAPDGNSPLNCNPECPESTVPEYEYEYYGNDDENLKELQEFYEERRRNRERNQNGNGNRPVVQQSGFNNQNNRPVQSGNRDKNQNVRGNNRPVNQQNQNSNRGNRPPVVPHGVNNQNGNRRNHQQNQRNNSNRNQQNQRNNSNRNRQNVNQPQTSNNNFGGNHNNNRNRDDPYSVHNTNPPPSPITTTESIIPFLPEVDYNDDNADLTQECPGGQLDACIDACPGFHARAFAICVEQCGKRCP